MSKKHKYIILAILVLLVFFGEKSYMIFADEKLLTNEEKENNQRLNEVKGTTANVEEGEEISVLAIYVCGDDLTATLTSDMTLTISGAGEMYDYTFLHDTTDLDKLCPWVENRLLIKKLVFEEGITKIGRNSCQFMSNVTDIILPEGLLVIDDLAFYQNESVKKIYIPSSVRKIGELSFNGCSSMEGVYIDDLDAWCEIEFGEYSDLLGYHSTYNPLTQCGNLYLDNELVTELIISNEVDKISDNAFLGCTSIKSVKFPDSLKSIGHGAFSQCTNLKNIYVNSLESWCNMEVKSNDLSDWTFYLEDNPISDLIIPNTITSISDYAFCGCTSITSVMIPDNVIELGKSSFEKCDNLSAVNMGNGINKLGEAVFAKCSKLIQIVFSNAMDEVPDKTLMECSSLSNVLIPDSILSIGNQVFQDCAELNNITLPNGVLSIGNQVFQNCEKLESVIVPDSVSYIGMETFKDCTNMKSITLSNSLTSIEDSLFENCVGLVNINIPESVGAIGKSAFMGCSNLNRLIMGNNVAIMEDSAFQNCTCLTDISLSNNLTDISEYVFAGCTSISKIILPENIDEIKIGAFQNCNNLKEIIFLGDAPIIDMTAFNGVTATCYYSPNETWTNEVLTEDFGGDLIWTYEGEEIPDNANQCGENIIWELSPDGVLTISGEGAMFDYSHEEMNYAPWYESKNSVTSVLVDTGVTHIGASAFYSCHKIKTVSIANSVLTIGDYAFAGCKLLATVQMSEKMKDLGAHTFEDCYAIQEIKIPDSVTELKDYVFARCEKLKSVTLPSNLKTIGNRTFYRCIKLNNLEFPEGLVSIGDYAFSQVGDTTLDGYSFTKVILPNSVKSIGMGVFNMCRSLSNVVLPEGLLTIGERAFRFCTSLSAIEIPASVKVIEDYMFDNDSALKSVIFKGDAPEFKTSSGTTYYTFISVVATCYYPTNNATWTEDVMQNYGGKLTWVSLEMGNEAGGLPGEGSEEENTGESESDGTSTGDSSGNDGNTLVNISISNVGESESGAVIIPPTDGWKIGTNTFTVTCENVCIAVVSQDGGESYTKVIAVEAEEGHTFTIENMTADTLVSILVLGDVNGDGKVTNADSIKLTAVILGKTNIDTLSAMASDVNNSGEITTADLTKLKAVILGRTSFSW